MATRAAPRPAEARADVPRPVAGLVDRPRLLALLDQVSPVTLVCAPAGSGKTMLLSAWLRGTSAGTGAWVTVQRDEGDPTRFWGMVMDALRSSGALAPDDPLATLTPAPLGGQEEFLTRLLEGLGRLSGPLFLVLDDLHELRSPDALRDLEWLLARAPASLRAVLASRRDLALGLHRRRLAGELTEIRAADLAFTGEEAAELLAAAEIAVGPDEVARLHGRTEGWAAGLRLAALSLARHPDPGRFVAEFSGSERTVSEYLVGEVLSAQPPEVRELLLRTSILERVNGPLADLLTGRDDGHRLLHGLEASGALVAAVDVGRSWFRCHRLLADLLALELRREAPGDVAELHRRAAGWLAADGQPVEAIRHAELGGDWDLAVELLGRHWVHLFLEGEEATLAALLAGLPADLAARDGEVATIAAADALAEGRWPEADALLRTAGAALPAVPPARRGRAATALAIVRLIRARRLGGLDEVVDDARSVLHGDDGGGDPAGAELQALALLNLGIAETWTLRLADAEEHLEHGLALANRLGRPYLEIGCLTSLAGVATLTRRLDRAERMLRQAIGIAERVGWTTYASAGVAAMSLGALLVERGMVAEGEDWLGRADPVLSRAPEPAANVALRHAQGMLAICHGRLDDALAAFRDGERLTAQLRAPHFLALVERQWQLRVLLRLGDAAPARAAVAAAGGAGGAQLCSLAALVRLADGDPDGAAAAVAPVLDGTVFAFHDNMAIEARLLDALARTRLGEPEAAWASVEDALAIAESQGRVWIFLTVPGARGLLAAHPLHRTAHAAHLKLLLDHLAGVAPEPAARRDLLEPLSERELAVLRFLPTNLSAGEVGGELFLSVHTVKTHMRKLYAKLGVHTRAEAVQRGRALGLLAPPRRG